MQKVNNMVLTLVKLALISQGAKKDHAASTYGKPDKQQVQLQRSNMPLFFSYQKTN